jgi:hypothetical protein
MRGASGARRTREGEGGLVDELALQLSCGGRVLHSERRGGAVELRTSGGRDESVRREATERWRWHARRATDLLGHSSEEGAVSKQTEDGLAADRRLLLSDAADESELRRLVGRLGAGHIAERPQ